MKIKTVIIDGQTKYCVTENNVQLLLTEDE